MNKRYILSIVLILFSIIFILPGIHSAKITNYETSIYINGPQSTHVVENWYIETNPLYTSDLKTFKQRILEADLDPAKLILIDPNLRPHIYINIPTNFTIKFDDIKKTVTIEYTITDLAMINYFENNEEILWQFNSNMFNNFVINHLYSIPKESSLTISLYEPLTLDDSTPGKIDDRKLILSGYSSNELKILALEKKPPKPSFFFTNVFGDMGQKGMYNYLLIVIVLIGIVFIFRKKLKSRLQKFVIKNSVIEPKKVKKEFFDDEIIEE